MPHLPKNLKPPLPSPVSPCHIFTQVGSRAPPNKRPCRCPCLPAPLVALPLKPPPTCPPPTSGPAPSHPQRWARPARAARGTSATHVPAPGQRPRSQRTLRVRGNQPVSPSVTVSQFVSLPVGHCAGVGGSGGQNTGVNAVEGGMSAAGRCAPGQLAAGPRRGSWHGPVSLPLCKALGQGRTMEGAHPDMQPWWQPRCIARY